MKVQRRVYVWCSFVLRLIDIKMPAPYNSPEAFGGFVGCYFFGMCSLARSLYHFFSPPLSLSLSLINLNFNLILIKILKLKRKKTFVARHHLTRCVAAKKRWQIWRNERNKTETRRKQHQKRIENLLSHQIRLARLPASRAYSGISGWSIVVSFWEYEGELVPIRMQLIPLWPPPLTAARACWFHDIT